MSEEKKTKVSIWSLIIGIIFVVLGLGVLTVPLETLIGMGIYLGAAFFVGGILRLVEFFSVRSSVGLLILGLLDLGIGILFLSDIGSAVATLPLMLGFWVLFSGITRVAFSFQLKDLNVSGWGWSMAFGIIGILLAFLIFYYPVVGAVSLVIFLSATMVVYGLTDVLDYFMNKSSN